MFAIIGRDQRQLQRVRSALPEVECAVAAEDLHALHSAALGAECLIVVSDGLLGADLAVGLRSLAEHFPLIPAVLVVRTEARAASVRRQSPVEVVWLDDVEHALRPAVNRALCRTVFDRLAITLEHASGIPPHLRAALAYACRCQPPVHHVADLACATACDRSSLWRDWHSALGDARCSGRCARLEDFMRWVVLLRATTRKTPHRSWFAVSEELHLHQHTLARLARRLTSQSLHELEVGGPLAILPIFARDVIELLTGANVG